MADADEEFLVVTEASSSGSPPPPLPARSGRLNPPFRNGGVTSAAVEDALTATLRTFRGIFQHRASFSAAANSGFIAADVQSMTRSSVLLEYHHRAVEEEFCIYLHLNRQQPRNWCLIVSVMVILLFVVGAPERVEVQVSIVLGVLLLLLYALATFVGERFYDLHRRSWEALQDFERPRRDACEGSSGQAERDSWGRTMQFDDSSSAAFARGHSCNGPMRSLSAGQRSSGDNRQQQHRLVKAELLAASCSAPRRHMRDNALTHERLMILFQLAFYCLYFGCFLAKRSCYGISDDKETIDRVCRDVFTLDGSFLVYLLAVSAGFPHRLRYFLPFVTVALLYSILIRFLSVMGPVSERLFYTSCAVFLPMTTLAVVTTYFFEKWKREMFESEISVCMSSDETERVRRHVFQMTTASLAFDMQPLLERMAPASPSPSARQQKVLQRSITHAIADSPHGIACVIGFPPCEYVSAALGPSLVAAQMNLLCCLLQQHDEEQALHNIVGGARRVNYMTDVGPGQRAVSGDTTAVSKCFKSRICTGDDVCLCSIPVNVPPQHLPSVVSEALKELLDTVAALILRIKCLTVYTPRAAERAERLGVPEFTISQLQAGLAVGQVQWMAVGHCQGVHLAAVGGAVSAARAVFASGRWYQPERVVSPEGKSSTALLHHAIRLDVSAAPYANALLPNRWVHRIGAAGPQTPNQIDMSEITLACVHAVSRQSSLIGDLVVAIGRPVVVCSVDRMYSTPQADTHHSSTHLLTSTSGALGARCGSPLIGVVPNLTEADAAPAEASSSQPGVVQPQRMSRVSITSPIGHASTHSQSRLLRRAFEHSTASMPEFHVAALGMSGGESQLHSTATVTPLETSSGGCCSCVATEQTSFSRCWGLTVACRELWGLLVDEDSEETRLFREAFIDAAPSRRRFLLVSVFASIFSSVTAILSNVSSTSSRRSTDSDSDEPYEAQKVAAGLLFWFAAGVSLLILVRQASQLPISASSKLIPQPEYRITLVGVWCVFAAYLVGIVVGPSNSVVTGSPFAFVAFIASVSFLLPRWAPLRSLVLVDAAVLGFMLLCLSVTSGHRFAGSQRNARTVYIQFVLLFFEIVVLRWIEDQQLRKLMLVRHSSEAHKDLLLQEVKTLQEVLRSFAPDRRVAEQLQRSLDLNARVPTKLASSQWNASVQQRGDRQSMRTNEMLGYFHDVAADSAVAANVPAPIRTGTRERFISVMCFERAAPAAASGDVTVSSSAAPHPQDSSATKWASTTSAIGADGSTPTSFSASHVDGLPGAVFVAALHDVFRGLCALPECEAVETYYLVNPMSGTITHVTLVADSGMLLAATAKAAVRRVRKFAPDVRVKVVFGMGPCVGAVVGDVSAASRHMALARASNVPQGNSSRNPLDVSHAPTGGTSVSSFPSFTLRFDVYGAVVTQLRALIDVVPFECAASTFRFLRHSLWEQSDAGNSDWGASFQDLPQPAKRDRFIVDDFSAVSSKGSHAVSETWTALREKMVSCLRSSGSTIDGVDEDFKKSAAQEENITDAGQHTSIVAAGRVRCGVVFLTSAVMP